MDFFSHQEQAKRRSRRLVVLFTLAVIAIVAVVYLAASAGLVWSASPPFVPPWFDPLRLLAVTVGVVAVVGLGSAYKIAQLAGGGVAVAEMLGGRLVEPGAADPLERRLLNVVEELAIASGLPVPPVYLLDESGINAFAAGTEPGNAVLGFTRGAIEKLSRAELQGVVGHEYSHVLNGDMRLNLRLIGVLHGILVIGLIGQYVFDTVRWAPTRSRDNTSSVTVVALVLGLTLVILGIVGTFFGRWIQAALSRQREFLADASAVQFTRDPSGIAGALKKIGGFPSGSQVREKHAGEVSHMLFEEHGVPAARGRDHGHTRRMFATHPPLAERIARVEPGFSGGIEERTEPTSDELDELRVQALAEEGGRSAMAAAAPAESSGDARLSASDLGVLSASAGSVDHDLGPRVRALLDELPPPVLRGAGEPYDARAIVCGLLLASEEDARSRQLELLGAERGDDARALAARVAALAGPVGELAPEARLPVLDLCLRSLRELTVAQYRTFTAALDTLIAADARIELFEATLRRIVRRHLDPVLLPDARPRGGRPLGLEAAGGRMSVVLSLLARAGHEGRAAAERAYAAAAGPLGLPTGLLDPQTAWRGFDDAIGALERLHPKDKQRFLEAAARTVEDDGTVTVAEAELYRAIAETLGVPVPSPLAAVQRGTAARAPRTRPAPTN